MHGGVAAATYLVGRRAASRPVQLPVVAVKLVRPQAPVRRAPSTRPQRRSTPVPQPTNPPPTAVPKPSAVPQRHLPSRKTRQPAPTPCERPSRSATPAPTPPPAAPGGGGGGLSVGQDAGGGTAGIPSDFHFTYYIERMLALIESRWYKPACPPAPAPRWGFVILKSGRLEIDSPRRELGQPSFDRAALRALYAANPLPPCHPPTANRASPFT